MNKASLQDKWWYRLVQVVFGLAFGIVAFVGIFVAWQEKPYKILDREKSYIKCTNNNFRIFLATNGIDILAGKIAYKDEERKTKLSCATEEQKSSLKTLAFDASNVDSWSINYEVITVEKWADGEWSEYIKNIAIGIIVYFVAVWLTRRIFFYVTIKENFDRF